MEPNQVVPVPSLDEKLDDLIEKLRKELQIWCWCEPGDEEGTVTQCHNCAFLHANIREFADWLSRNDAQRKLAYDCAKSVCDRIAEIVGVQNDNGKFSGDDLVEAVRKVAALSRPAEPSPTEGLSINPCCREVLKNLAAAVKKVSPELVPELMMAADPLGTFTKVLRGELEWPPPPSESSGGTAK